MLLVEVLDIFVHFANDIISGNPQVDLNSNISETSFRSILSLSVVQQMQLETCRRHVVPYLIYYSVTFKSSSLNLFCLHSVFFSDTSIARTQINKLLAITFHLHLLVVNPVFPELFRATS